MGLEKRVLSFRTDEELIEKLKMIANEQNRSLSNLIETALKKYIAENTSEKD